jgi:glycosyltransferase involved in cell wall biosynthesis
MFEVEEKLDSAAFSIAGQPPSAESAADAPSALAALAAESGLERVHVVAWRDLEDPEAGGSEVHLHEILRRWAEAGLAITLRTSSVDGGPDVVERDGYRVERRQGRYAVFPRAAGQLTRMRPGRTTGVVEVWNGMPFLTPLWAPRAPRVVVLHHVHAEMWQMVLSRGLGRMGRTFESRVAPLAYRRTRIVTLSASSAAEIVSMLKVPAEQVTVVPVGVDARFSPGGVRASDPLVVAVGRLVPVKRFDLLIDAIVALRPSHPALRVVIVGEGYERDALEAHVRARRAEGYVSLPGRLGDSELVDLYRRAWVLASTSLREGWGMTVTEAAACGTPAVATRIAGHLDSVVHGVTGLLAEPGEELVAQLHSMLSDEVMRRRLGAAAAARAATLSWDASARGVLGALAVEAAAVRE